MRTTSVLSAAILFSVGLIATRPAAADVLFEGGFETGDLSQWQRSLPNIDGRWSVVDDPVRYGDYAGRVEVRAGDRHSCCDRNEINFQHTAQELENEERFYGVSVYFPENPGDHWHGFFYIEALNVWMPVFGLGVRGNTVYASLNFPRDGNSEPWTETIAFGQWHDFAVKVKYSDDPNVGYVEVWYDGTKVVDRAYGKTMLRNGANELEGNLFQTGMIRPADLEGHVDVMFHDGYRETTTLNEAMHMDAVVPDAGVPDAGLDAGQDAGTDASVDASAQGDADVDDAIVSPDTNPTVDVGNDTGDEGPSGGGCAVSPTMNSSSLLLACGLLFLLRRRR